MQKIVLLIMLVSLTIQLKAQVPPKDTVPPGSSILAFYEGRTACRELLQALNMPDREECAKRKIWMVLYVDKVTKLPSTYKAGGLGIRSGTGKWSIEKGIPGHPEAIVYRLDMGEVSLFLLKGDEQVLFILDKQKMFLVGNEKYSYTLNRNRAKG
ncbi:hypothetical protein [Chitinophaga niabensis]|uniref:NlpE N-terminal domain-containing protein n=1 Tax=Chitinophaga niabensis TaxID=536979 RepID=A0A1N6EPN6_9BACT|nr:hypothetical protein [Chitinophaga niabensis]SIN85052.1 hypothetical protein SAMN04488055_1753 [Chitinophaga niabensis]